MQILRATNHHERKRWRQPHGHHIGCYELPETNTGIESLSGDICQLRARGDLQLDLGIGSVERNKHRFENQWDNRARNGKPQ